MGNNDLITLTDDDSSERLLEALEAEAKKIGFTEVSRRSGIPRPHLYMVFSRKQGNPSLDTIRKIANAVGYRIWWTRSNGELERRLSEIQEKLTKLLSAEFTALEEENSKLREEIGRFSEMSENP